MENSKPLIFLSAADERVAPLTSKNRQRDNAKPPPGADKVMRLHACSDRFENGRVLVPANAPLLDDYIVELIGFPGTKHDDQVDSTTQALDYLREPDLLATYLKAYS